VRGQSGSASCRSSTDSNVPTSLVQEAYGTRCAYRAAAWTFFGVGGNLIEDACYTITETDGHGEPLGSAHRYAVGDRSGLSYADDGSLTLFIQAEEPDPRSGRMAARSAPRRVQARPQGVLAQARSRAGLVAAAAPR
jgi:hypothetical protein